MGTSIEINKGSKSNKQSQEKLKTIQIRIGQKTSDNFKEWVENQTNANDSAKRILEHFIRVYGTADIDSDEVQILMAKDLLNSKGLEITHSVGNLTEEVVSEASEVVPETKAKDSLEELKVNDNTVVPTKKVKSRGQIDV